MGCLCIHIRDAIATASLVALIFVFLIRHGVWSDDGGIEMWGTSQPDFASHLLVMLLGLVPSCSTDPLLYSELAPLLASI